MPSVNLNSRFLKNLKLPAEGRVQYYDTHTTGLVLRVSSSGAMTWSVEYRVNGNPLKRRWTIGTIKQFGLAEARQKAQEAITAAAKGEDPAGAKQINRQAPTFEEFAEDYLTRHASQKKSGFKDRQIIEANLTPEWGRRKAADIKRRDVIEILDKIKDRGAPIMANRVLALVRKMYNWGLSRDIVELNPCAAVKAPAKENRKDRVLSADEIKSFWTGLEKTNMSEAVRRALKLILVTAQRPGEIATAALAEMDLKAAWWTIPATKAKNGMAHRVPLSALALSLIEPSKENEQFLFPSPRGEGKRSIEEHALCTALRRNLEHIEDAAPFTPHDLRRTAASHMTSIGIPRLVVSKILNHAEPGVTAVYDRHSYDAEKRDALRKWERALQTIIGGKSAKVVKLR